MCFNIIFFMKIYVFGVLVVCGCIFIFVVFRVMFGIEKVFINV